MQCILRTLAGGAIPLVGLIALSLPSAQAADAVGPYGPGYGYGYGYGAPAARGGLSYFNHPAMGHPGMMYSARRRGVAAVAYQYQPPMPTDAPGADAPAPMPNGPMADGSMSSSATQGTTAAATPSTIYGGYPSGGSPLPYYYGGHYVGGDGLLPGYGPFPNGPMAGIGPYAGCEYGCYGWKKHHPPCLIGFLFGWMHPHKCGTWYDKGCDTHFIGDPYGVRPW